VRPTADLREEIAVMMGVAGSIAGSSGGEVEV
jgi:hypothetical protein